MFFFSLSSADPDSALAVTQGKHEAVLLGEHGGAAVRTGKQKTHGATLKWHTHTHTVPTAGGGFVADNHIVLLS